MTLHVLEMPNDAASLAAWLEDLLVSDTLGELVAELAAAHPAGAPRTETLDSLLGPQLESVLTGGLSTLPESVLRDLVRHPWVLLELQERIFIDGGNHWSRGKPSADETAALNRIWSKVSAGISAELRNTPSAATKIVSPAANSRRSSWKRALVLSAATFLLGLSLRTQPRVVPPIQPNPPAVAQTGWGWNKPDTLKQDVARDVYLKELADAANEWFAKTPDSRAALATRMNQFRQGCSMLLLSEHKPLPDEDRAWLLERCRDWATKVEGQLRDLEAGGDFETIRTATDRLMTTLITRLRERAVAT